MKCLRLILLMLLSQLWLKCEGGGLRESREDQMPSFDADHCHAKRTSMPSSGELSNSMSSNLPTWLPLRNPCPPLQR